MSGATQQIQRANTVGIHGASALSDVKRQGVFNRPLSTASKKNGKGKQGIFLEYPQGVREAIMMVAIEDAPATRAHNQGELARQDAARLAKEGSCCEKRT